MIVNGTRVKKYRGMGSLEAMTKGSEVRAGPEHLTLSWAGLLAPAGRLACVAFRPPACWLGAHVNSTCEQHTTRGSGLAVAPRCLPSIRAVVCSNPPGAQTLTALPPHCLCACPAGAVPQRHAVPQDCAGRQRHRCAAVGLARGWLLLPGFCPIRDCCGGQVLLHWTAASASASPL